MRATRACFTSQINLYRVKNLQYINGGVKNRGTVPVVICEAVVDSIKAVKKILGHIDIPEYLKPPRRLENLDNEKPFRNTSPDEMNASTFKIDCAIQSLNKLKKMGSITSANAGRMEFSTFSSYGKAAGNCKSGTQSSLRNRTNACGSACYDTTIRRAFTSDDRRQMTQSALPTDRITRAATVAGYMINMASNTAKEALQRYMRGERGDVIQRSMNNDENMKLLVDCLCKMRGTALKFGQLLSLQHGILPESMRRALVSVRHRADVMPEKQVREIMAKELGKDWMEMLQDFEWQAMASASLGQVHGATTRDGKRVCVKIQFPGISDSIDSDISNLLLICTKTQILPKNFFAEHFTTELRLELESECNYHNEANFCKIFKQLTLDGFAVPDVIDEMSTKRVITTAYVPGVPIEDCKHLSQDIRDSIGDRLLTLSLSEIFAFGLMNTDPNPSNYLYEEKTDLIGLIDFGACRSYDQEFVRKYYLLVKASVEKDMENIIKLSYQLGFLNDQDSQEMIQHHVESVLMTGEPFRQEGRFDFGTHNILKECREKGSIILKIRKQPPPPEIYSLHRKLAGCYVICQVLRARVKAREIFTHISLLR